ncbi:hypothetical protein H0H81_005435, partial [Sphagnurus paluster]
MDYDRNDALLHWLFRQTQGDAWFRPNEENIPSGVALRISDINDPVPEFRVFPYENPSLEPFEVAIAALNPAVAVKIRSAAVHAALAGVNPEERFVYVDSNTRIQVIDTMLALPAADKEQCAAFIRDERVLVIWSDAIDRIVPACTEFEERLIKLLWHVQPSSQSSPQLSIPPQTPMSPEGLASARTSVEALASAPLSVAGPASRPASLRTKRAPTPKRHSLPGSVSFSVSGTHTHTPARTPTPPYSRTPTARRTWYRRHVSGTVSREKEQMVDLEQGQPEYENRETGMYAEGKAGEYSDDSETAEAGVDALDPKRDVRGTVLLAPLYNGLAAGLALSGLGPIEQYHANSRYYSAIKPRPQAGSGDERLPHITIQMPVYKEALGSVLAPSILSLKRAMQTYARQGGTSAIFVNDDGMRLLAPAERAERLAFYTLHNVGWVARPPHGDLGENEISDQGERFLRAGRFKKASNMNYGLALSLKLERHLARLVAQHQQQEREKSTAQSQPPNSTAVTTEDDPRSNSASSSPAPVQTTGVSSPTPRPCSPSPSPNAPNLTLLGIPGSLSPLSTEKMGLEDQALALAIEETWATSQGGRHRPWAANGRATRIGELVLLVDSDTIVPEDCLRDAAREMRECPSVAIIQHESDVMQVAHHYFENGIAYFTRRINKCISLACANGEVAPFVGHNAFLRWRALQDAAFVDPADGQEKIWSESNVSEDFDMALRLMGKGYIVRYVWCFRSTAFLLSFLTSYAMGNFSWATYSQGGFKEGVSLSVDDELNRWQKYAYGCSELLFNPLIQWLRRGPVAHQIHKFMWSSAPLHYKISMMAYMFSYYGIAASATISIINYVLLGFQFGVDGFYMHSFEIWLATTVVFFGSGTVGYSLLQYRLGQNKLVPAFLENVMWIPFFFFFFGGLSIPVSQAILAHVFSYDISWSATIKEVERSNFFKEIPKIARR